MQAINVGVGSQIGMVSALAQAAVNVVTIPGPTPTGNAYDRLYERNLPKPPRNRDTKSYPDYEKEARKKKIAAKSRRTNRNKK